MKSDLINRILTFVIGGGLAGTVSFEFRDEVDMYLRWSVYVVTILLGLIKLFLMMPKIVKRVKKWRKK